MKKMTKIKKISALAISLLLCVNASCVAEMSSIHEATLAAHSSETCIEETVVPACQNACAGFSGERGTVRIPFFSHTSIATVVALALSRVFLLAQAGEVPSAETYPHRYDSSRARTIDEFSVTQHESRYQNCDFSFYVSDSSDMPTYDQIMQWHSGRKGYSMRLKSLSRAGVNPISALLSILDSSNKKNAEYAAEDMVRIVTRMFARDGDVSYECAALILSLAMQLSNDDDVLIRTEGRRLLVPMVHECIRAYPTLLTEVVGFALLAEGRECDRVRAVLLSCIGGLSQDASFVSSVDDGCLVMPLLTLKYYKDTDDPSAFKEADFVIKLQQAYRDGFSLERIVGDPLLSEWYVTTLLMQIESIVSNTQPNMVLAVYLDLMSAYLEALGREEPSYRDSVEKLVELLFAGGASSWYEKEFFHWCIQLPREMIRNVFAQYPFSDQWRRSMNMRLRLHEYWGKGSDTVLVDSAQLHDIRSLPKALLTDVYEWVAFELSSGAITEVSRAAGVYAVILELIAAEKEYDLEDARLLALFYEQNKSEKSSGVFLCETLMRVATELEAAEGSAFRKMLFAQYTEAFCALVRAESKKNEYTYLTRAYPDLFVSGEQAGVTFLEFLALRKKELFSGTIWVPAAIQVYVEGRDIFDMKNNADDAFARVLAIDDFFVEKDVAISSTSVKLADALITQYNSMIAQEGVVGEKTQVFYFAHSDLKRNMDEAVSLLSAYSDHVNDTVASLQSFAESVDTTLFGNAQYGEYDVVLWGDAHAWLSKGNMNTEVCIKDDSGSREWISPKVYADHVLSLAKKFNADTRWMLVMSSCYVGHYMEDVMDTLVYQYRAGALKSLPSLVVSFGSEHATVPVGSIEYGLRAVREKRGDFENEGWLSGSDLVYMDRVLLRYDHGTDMRIWRRVDDVQLKPLRDAVNTMKKEGGYQYYRNLGKNKLYRSRYTGQNNKGYPLRYVGLRMGKRVVIDSVVENDSDTLCQVSFLDKRRHAVVFPLTQVPEDLYARIMRVVQQEVTHVLVDKFAVSPDYRAVSIIAQLFNKHMPSRLETFDVLVGDLFGFSQAAGAGDRIAVYSGMLQSIASGEKSRIRQCDIVAVFHELLEYWIASGDIHVRRFGRNVRIAEGKTGTAIGFIELSSEEMRIANKGNGGLNDEAMHYLIRALQRRLFGSDDRMLTDRIKFEQLMMRVYEGAAPQQVQELFEKSLETYSDYRMSLFRDQLGVILGYLSDQDEEMLMETCVRETFAHTHDEGMSLPILLSSALNMYHSERIKMRFGRRAYLRAA